jgi:hypothetical protein
MEQAPKSDLQPWADLSRRRRHPTHVAHPILCLRGEYPNQNHFGTFWGPCLDGDPGAILAHDAYRLSWPFHDGRPHEFFHLANDQTRYFCYHVEEGSKRTILHKTMTHNRGRTDETTLRGIESIGHQEDGLTMGLDPSSQHTRIHLCLHCACGTHHAKGRYACRHRGLHTILDGESET